MTNAFHHSDYYNKAQHVKFHPQKLCSFKDINICQKRV